MATYAVGDIQGCGTEFRQLLELIGFDPKTDRLWLVGDLVNRGPDSLGVLRLVKSLGDAAITVLGNHDLHLLAVAEGVAELHRSDTLDDILKAPDRDELLDWLRVITNAFTRMRICTVRGEMEFKFKGTVGDIPQGYFPWFEVPERAGAVAAIVCGHWSALGLKVTPNVIALDTGCLWGGPLSAIRLEDRKLFQVPCSTAPVAKDW